MKNKYIDISSGKIGEGHPVFIIAEAGVNHNGSLKRAKRMVDIAKAVGADAVKFQTYITEEMLAPYAPKADYQKKTAPGRSQFEMIKALELSQSDFKELFNYCRKKRIMFLSTPFDNQSADFLNKLGVPAFKISSGELTNIPFLLRIANFLKPIVLSTGMATIEEIKEAAKIIYSTGNKKLILLHCTSNYPTAFADVNLKAMPALAEKFGVMVGYSDHTPGIEIPVAAAALGARIIEKHFTLDRSMAGPDQQASLEPEEFRRMVSAVRNVEKSMGNGRKKPGKSERRVALVARKSIMAAADFIKGTRLSPEMLAVKRPGTGIEPKYISKIIGRKIKKDIKKDQLIKWGMLR
jgi:N-acetylneuraminate synthase/N,N'-diacetyllegionaminate synthase